MISCCTNGVYGSGSTEYGVMIIGIAPGKDEMRTKQPFSGQSGRLMNAILEAAKWHRDKTFCTNLVCTGPNQEPSAEEIENCRPRLLEEIATVKPRLIVCLGDVPTRVMTGRELKDIRGAVLWSDEYKCFVMGTYHPAGILYGNPYIVGTIYRDFRKIELTQDWPVCPPEQPKYIVVTSSAQAVVSALPDFVAIDIETSSLELDEYDSFVDKLLCVAAATEDNVYVFPADVLKGVKWPNRKWIFHNGMFDAQGMKRFLDVDMTIAEDTMLQSYSVDERSGFHRLKTLAREYCGAGFYETSVSSQRKSGDIDKDELYKYNALDAYYTRKLHYVLLKLQKEDNVESPYKYLLIPAANAYREINQRGVYINRKVMSQLIGEWGPAWLEAQEKARNVAREYGWKGDINLNSPTQINRLLYDICNIPCTERSTRAEILEELDHPFVDALLEYRTVDHIISTYILGFADDIKSDGRVHPSVLLHGTVTGRPSYRNPPLQTLPKEHKVGKYAKIREMFSATNDDYVIVEADYSRAEIWMAYAYCKDPQMLEDLKGDVHRQVAAAAFGKKPEDVTDAERHAAKTITFGIMYGRGPKALAKQIGYTEQEAYRFVRNWFNRYPKYEEWFKRTRKEAEENGEIVSLTGRKRRFYLVYGDKAYKALNQAVNFGIQSTSSDVCISAVIYLHNALKQYDSYVLFSVHDSIIFEVNKKYLDKALKLIHFGMTQQFFDGVPGIPVEIAYGPSWGQAKVKYVADSN